MSRTRALEIGVGAFMAAGIVALFFLAMQVSNLSVTATSEGYQIKARFDNIGSLKVRSPVNWEATHRLGAVRVSTLVITVGADVLGSNHVAQSEVLAKRIPKAEYKILEGQSHGFFWEVPDEVNAWILDWVQSL